jgi:hypothetical protein
MPFHFSSHFKSSLHISNPLSLSLSVPKSKLQDTQNKTQTIFIFPSLESFCMQLPYLFSLVLFSRSLSFNFFLFRSLGIMQ